MSSIMHMGCSRQNVCTIFKKLQGQFFHVFCLFYFILLYVLFSPFMYFPCFIIFYFYFIYFILYILYNPFRFLTPCTKRQCL